MEIKAYENEIYRIIKVLFDLDDKDMLIIDLFMTSHFPELCIKEIKKINALPERTIQRRLNQLVKKGLIIRRPLSISEFIDLCFKHQNEADFSHDKSSHGLGRAKGYIYLYKLIPKEDLRKLFTSIIEIWK